METKKELIKLRSLNKNLKVKDYQFINQDGNKIKLSELFDDKNEIIISFNMGKKCPYCTLWADSYNGIIHHLENRSPFFVISPDSPEVQKEFSNSRDWNFKMLSYQNMDFYKELGFFDGKDGSWPGASALIKNKDGKIYQYSKTFYGPGDNFCSMWDFNDLLPISKKMWEPKYKY